MSEDLESSELVCTGGTWHGLLFATPQTGMDTELFWEFAFEYQSISRDYGATTPNLVVDWAPLPGRAWHDMAGATILGQTFGQPVESSVYYFDHFRYRHAQLAVVEQTGRRLRVRAEVSGDIDELGLPGIQVEDWLDFTGIIVQLPDPPGTVADAERALQQFTSTEGLVGSDSGRNFLFAPDGDLASR